MNLFTAQKHASFAAELFTAAGFDFSAALAANDAEALKTHIAAQSPAVAALFTSAGLNLETLLAAGPDSLKAHLETCSVKAEEFSALETKLSETTTKLGKSERDVMELSEANTLITAAIGLTGTAAHTDATAIKTAFETHVAKQVVLANAKAGHPPVHQIDPNAGPAAEQLTDEAHLAAYEKLEGAEAKAYLSTHSQALWRADIARRTRRSQ